MVEFEGQTERAIALCKELDIATVDAMQRALLEHARQVAPADCVIDCSGCTFMGSVGLRALVSVVDAVGPDRKVVLLDVRPPVRRLLEMTDLGRLFTIVASGNAEPDSNVYC